MANPQAGLPAAPPNRHALAAALVTLLEREQAQLTAPEPDALQALAQEKLALCQALAPRAAGARAHAASHRDDPATRALLARAQHLNTANASLLAMQRMFCESRLQLLRGGERSATTYRANGFLRF